MSTHTPGPWEFNEDFKEIQAHSGMITICDVDTEPVTSSAARAEVEANARLIAAAPELLAASLEVEAMHSWLRSFYNDVMNTVPEYADRCGDWNAAQYMMQDCAGIAARAAAAIAKARPS